MAIPKRIIQSHESEYTFRDAFVGCRARLLEFHPDFEYRFFCAHERREFVRRHRQDLLELYDFYPRNIQRADLFRIIAIYELGGFYIDLDVHFHEPLDELCEGNLVLTEEWTMKTSDYERRHSMPPVDACDLVQIGNYGFAACAGHWFFSEIIDEMLRRAESVNPSTVRTEDVFFSTGPDMLNAVYARFRDRLRGEVTILQGPDHNRTCQFGKFGTHLMVGSWA